MYRLDLGASSPFPHIIMKERQNLHLFTEYLLNTCCILGKRKRDNLSIQNYFLTLSAMPESL